MAYLTVNNRPMDSLFGNIFGEFLNDFNKKDVLQTIPVNVKETENSFELDVVAPGFEKTDFNISLDQDLLTISAEKKADAIGEKEKTLRKEYGFKSFKRSFTVDNLIDATEINAAYVNGVLKLTLPKKQEAKQIKKQILIK
jgi:HSP20 family protein